MNSEKPVTNEDILQAVELRFEGYEKRFDDGDKRFETLATKEDIREMKEAFGDFVKAIKIFRATSKWGYRALLVVASIIVAIVSLGSGWKVIASWFKTPL